MKPGVINIPTSVGPRAWASCFRAIAKRTGIFGINEAFAPKAKALYLILAVARGFRQYGVRKSPNPIFWRRRHWRKVSGRVIKLHDALSRHHDWPGFNEARYVTEVVLRHRRRLNSPQVTVLNTHWVPEGDKVDPTDRAYARSASLREVRALVLEHLAAGRIVIPMGDFNIYAAIEMNVPGFVWIRREGVDKLGVVLPEGWALDDIDLDVFRAATDHGHGIAADLTITKESR